MRESSVLSSAVSVLASSRILVSSAAHRHTRARACKCLSRPSVAARQKRKAFRSCGKSEIRLLVRPWTSFPGTAKSRRRPFSLVSVLSAVDSRSLPCLSAANAGYIVLASEKSASKNCSSFPVSSETAGLRVHAGGVLRFRGARQEKAVWFFCSPPHVLLLVFRSTPLVATVFPSRGLLREDFSINSGAV